MCKQDFTWRKFLKLYLEVKFYSLLFPIIFIMIGKQEMTFDYCFKTLFGVAASLGKSFTATFMALFLLIPFINRLIKVMDRKSHARLLILLLLFYTIVGSFFMNHFFEYIGWYVTVYLIGAFLRLYPLSAFGELRKTSLFALISLLFSFATILFFTSVNGDQWSFSIYYFVADSNKILAILSAVAFFALFRSMNLGQIKWINYISSATFGIFLIHTRPNVREWLWYDVFRVKDFFHSDMLWLHAIVTLITVYVVCLIIDLLRQKFIEKPFFAWLDRKYPALNNKVK